MKNQYKPNRIDATVLRETISPEFNLIKTSDTMGGALRHLVPLFTKIQFLPAINQIIASAENELAKEDCIAFENLEKAVAWFHEKIKLLLPYSQRAKDSFIMAEINALINFETVSFNHSGYVGSLLFELRRLFSEVAKEEKNYHLFNGWTQRDDITGRFMLSWPEYVDKCLNPTPIDQQIYQWKERTDTSLPCLLRFLKILTLYNTFVPLTLEPYPNPNTLPKSLREQEERQYQAYVGYYLSLFKSKDLTIHPLSISDLVKMVDRLLYMLEQQIESHPSETSAVHREEVNIVINQFLFFSSNASKKNEDASHPISQTQTSPPKTEAPNKQTHWRTFQCDQDLIALIPHAKKMWLKEIASDAHPMRLSKKTLASDLLNKLPMNLFLYTKGNDRFPRALQAIIMTDPRIFNGGRYEGLKPHWENFEWVKI
jgi:hypothetical protein